MRLVLLFVSLILVGGCMGYPKGVVPVRGFDLDRYLGKWYEIARLDHSFERGLIDVTAEYSLRDDGGVRVLNKGYSVSGDRWKQAEAKAYFVDSPDEGYLKVSFFGPFYGSYVVFGLDKEDYQYAFVTSSTTSYLWLLARTPVVSQEVIQQFVRKSKSLGYDTDALIFVKQRK